MAVLERTIQQRRARVNVDSLLAFDGVDQYADAGVNSNVIGAVDYDRDFTISCLFQLNSLSGTQCLFSSLKLYNSVNADGFNLNVTTAGQIRFFLQRQVSSGHAFTSFFAGQVVAKRLYHLSLVYRSNTPSGTQCSVYINNVEQSVTKSTTKQINSSIHQGGQLVIGSAIGYTPSPSYSDSLVDHLSFFNRTLTESEIRSIHRHGGLLPQSTHEACVAHYVADREGLVMWDVVEQYNYTKESLQKYTPDNLSDFSTGGSVSYDPVDDRLSFNEPDFITAISNSSVAMEGLRQDNQYRVEVDVENYQRGQLEVRLNSRMASNFDPSDGTNVITFTQNKYGREVAGKPSFVCRNGPKFDITGYRIIPLTEPVLDAHHATLQNHTPQQVEGSQQSAYLDFYDKTPLRPFVDSDGDGEYDQPLVEKSSLLPPLVNALRFDAASNQYASVSGFVPTKEKGYTVVMAIQRDGVISGTEHLFSMDVARFRAYLTPTLIGLSNSTGIGGGGVLTYNTSHDFSSITLLTITIKQDAINPQGFWQLFLNARLVAQGGGTGTFVGFNELSGLLKIGRNSTTDDFNGNILSFGIAKGIITQRQVAELWNNSLLSNPKTHWRNLEWQLLPNFNQINDNAGTGSPAAYTLTDNSPQNHTINLQGFTAANLDPNDPAYALTQINSLR